MKKYPQKCSICYLKKYPPKCSEICRLMARRPNLPPLFLFPSIDRATGQKNGKFLGKMESIVLHGVDCAELIYTMLSSCCRCFNIVNFKTIIKVNRYSDKIFLRKIMLSRIGFYQRLIPSIIHNSVHLHIYMYGW